MKTGTKNQIKFTLYNVIKKMEIIYSFTRARICMVLFFFLTGFHFLPIDIHVLTSSYELAHCILHACLTQLIVTMLLCLLHKQKQNRIHKKESSRTLYSYCQPREDPLHGTDGLFTWTKKHRRYTSPEWFVFFSMCI